MDQQTIVTLVVGVIVTALGLWFRYVTVTDPLKSWLEMAFSVIGGLVVAFVLGKVPSFIDWGNPVATIQYLLGIATVIFTFTQIIYSALQDAFPDSKLVKGAFKSLKF